MERFEGEGEERGRGLKVWTPVKWRGGEARVENRDSTKLRKREYRITRGEIRRWEGEGERRGDGGGEGIISATATIYVFLEPVTRVCIGESMGINVILFLNVNALLFCFSAFNRPILIF